jgi:solute carrier family 45 protein 1/2/4
LDLDAGRADQARSTGGAGTILGIHNLAIVAPQFVVAIIASLIFSAVHSSHNNIHLVLTDPLLNLAATSTQDVANPAEGTVWVLRFGGTMALLAAAATRLVPLTLSERTKRFAPTRHDIDQDTE